MAILTPKEIKKRAQDLSQLPLELIGAILDKHHRAMIEQLQEEYAKKAVLPGSQSDLIAKIMVLVKNPPMRDAGYMCQGEFHSNSVIDYGIFEDQLKTIFCGG